MSENFVVEIISPDKTILKSEATEVTIPSYEGQMGILKDHIPLITFLRPGLIVTKKNEEENLFFVEEGTIEFSNNTLLILSSTVKSLKDLERLKFVFPDIDEPSLSDINISPVSRHVSKEGKNVELPPKHSKEKVLEKEEN